MQHTVRTSYDRSCCEMWSITQMYNESKDINHNNVPTDVLVRNTGAAVTIHPTCSHLKATVLKVPQLFHSLQQSYQP